VVEQVATTSETELKQASLLQYLGELMTETHMASPQGWEAARSGRAEDLSLIAAAAAR
jgi:hypothetical protein